MGAKRHLPKLCCKMKYPSFYKSISSVKNQICVGDLEDFAVSGQIHQSCIAPCTWVGTPLLMYLGT
jgi:hypothetical protein